MAWATSQTAPVAITNAKYAGARSCVARSIRTASFFDPRPFMPASSWRS